VSAKETVNRTLGRLTGYQLVRGGRSTGQDTIRTLDDNLQNSRRRVRVLEQEMRRRTTLEPALPLNAPDSQDDYW
jgi:hypothetical protein